MAILKKRPVLLNLCQGGVNSQSRAVGPVRGHDFHYVRNGDDPRFQHDVIFRKPFRVAPSSRLTQSMDSEILLGLWIFFFICAVPEGLTLVSRQSRNVISTAERNLRFLSREDSFEMTEHR